MEETTLVIEYEDAELEALIKNTTVMTSVTAS